MLSLYCHPVDSVKQLYFVLNMRWLTNVIKLSEIYRQVLSNVTALKWPI